MNRARELVHTWIRSDAVGDGLKMMLMPSNTNPLVNAIQQALDAVAQQARNQALEESIKILEEQDTCRYVEHVQKICACWDKAEAIRALKEKP